MKVSAWLGGVLLLTVGLPATAGLMNRRALERVNSRLCGRVIDYTHHNGTDNRIWSEALHERRDMYVYVPPGYDPSRRYPLVFFLHGFTQDEDFFLQYQVEQFDRVIASGQMPPCIIAAPDGSIQGRPTFFRSASFYCNSNAGRYEDYLLQDVWNFLVTHYPIRPEREAHALTGVSMGGSAAFRLGIEHRDRFGVVVGFMPPLNLRWVDCRGHYRTKFDPCCWGWRTELRPYELIGRFFGVIPVRFRTLSDPLFGRGPQVIDELSRINPIEVMDRCDLREGELEMYVAYGGQDELNVDAQVESFLYRARQRGLTVAVDYDPKGKHDLATGLRLFPSLIEWLAPRLAPYSPGSP
jgi:S-formylglutathione hydrolase FrmB